MKETNMDRFLRREVEGASINPSIKMAIAEGESPAIIALELLDSTGSKKRQHLIGLACTLGYLYQMRQYDSGKTPIRIPTLSFDVNHEPVKFHQDNSLGYYWNSEVSAKQFDDKYESALRNYSKEELSKIDLSYISKLTGSPIVQEMIVSGFYIGRYRFVRELDSVQ